GGWHAFAALRVVAPGRASEGRESMPHPLHSPLVRFLICPGSLQETDRPRYHGRQEAISRLRPCHPPREEGDLRSRPGWDAVSPSILPGAPTDPSCRCPGPLSVP